MCIRDRAAINPIILFPPLYSIFPEDNKDAPTNDKTIAAKVDVYKRQVYGIHLIFMYDIMLYNCIAHTLHTHPDRDSWQ